MAHLAVTLTVDHPRVLVTWRLHGVRLAAGDPLGRLPAAVAGAPTVALGEDAVVAWDERGAVPLVTDVAADDDGGAVRSWRVDRSTVGPVEVSYRAEPVTEPPRPATPPLELRRDGCGLSGAVACFVLLPPGPEDLTFELRWDRRAGAAEADQGWVAVSSLGGDARGGAVGGSGLELLGDTYVMEGSLLDRHHRDGQVSTWWTAPPRVDAAALTARLARTYRGMSETFDAPAHPYRVFLRTHPHRGIAASAHPASFVMALNPVDPPEEARLYETVAHELVHEWLQLDGTAEEVTWFVEGAADYYALVLALREGTLEEEAFLRAVNTAARECWANPRRHLTLREAQRRFFSDFLARRLPYVRGLFYLADLDARLQRAGSGRHSVDDVVRDVVRRRRAGERVGVAEWCSLVEDVTQEPELPVLDALVLTGGERPGPGCFGSRFHCEVVEVPVLDVGFDPATFVARRVLGLVPDGPADRAGLREGEDVLVPTYREVLGLDVGDVVEVGVTRGGRTSRVRLPPGPETVRVPRWTRRTTPTS